jgi:hypothetical protein
MDSHFGSWAFEESKVFWGKVSKVKPCSNQMNFNEKVLKKYII